MSIGAAKSLSSLPPPSFGPLEMLVIQATPFCNLDCKYCYLPSRQLKDRISEETLDAIFRRVFESDLARDPFMILWHAGEPFTLPPAFYEKAFAQIAPHNKNEIPVRHSFQSNATVVTDEWCRFLKSHRASLGISIDGPEFLHNRNRRTRSGAGTFDRVVRGVRKLQDADIPFGVISVLSKDSLNYPDELYDFYTSQGIRDVGFNVEEVEGTHSNSSMLGDEMRAKLATFFDRFFRLAHEGRYPLRVREFRRFAPLLSGVTLDRFDQPQRRMSNSEVKPFKFINIDHEGRFSTFSPELLGVKSKTYGDFYLGRVQDVAFAEVMKSEKFLRIYESIASGVSKCEQSCRYFGYCGGGAPVNKYFENGTFDSTESMHCRLSRQTAVDVVFRRLQIIQQTAQAAV